MTKVSPKAIAAMAVMTAVVAVFAMAIKIPIPATNGYFNFSDLGIYFTAFVFGPWVGLAAGGLGTALADVMGGYAHFAPITFLAHGLEGWLAGYLGGRAKSVWQMLLGGLVGTLAMVGIYFVGEVWLMGYTSLVALAEVPANLLQNGIGLLIGIPLVYAVRKAYPPIVQWGLGKTWREE